jgi:hypothetical protein
VVNQVPIIGGQNAQFIEHLTIKLRAWVQISVWFNAFSPFLLQNKQNVFSNAFIDLLFLISHLQTIMMILKTQHISSLYQLFEFDVCFFFYFSFS